jgi:hypothetical protein
MTTKLLSAAVTTVWNWDGWAGEKRRIETGRECVGHREKGETRLGAKLKHICAEVRLLLINR